jgi:acyl-CoA thioesterase FadM
VTNWIETYRGAVPPWQCDVTEHFTIAYYFDRLEEAEANLADALGLGHLPGHPALSRNINARFARELREGAAFHVESAVHGVADRTSDTALRMGHRFVDSASGEIVTWFDAKCDLPEPLTSRQHATVTARIATWNGPAAESRPEPTLTANFIPTARGRIKPGDVNAAGHFALGPIVHRFSNASAQTGAAIGMDAAFMRDQRRGFSTFELILRISGVLPLDAPYLIETGIAHLGSSSLRMIHRMTDPRMGTEVARLSQYGVNLDLDARRAARWPDDIRRRAQALIVPVA